MIGIGEINQIHGELRKNYSDRGFEVNSKREIFPSIMDSSYNDKEETNVPVWTSRVDNR